MGQEDALLSGGPLQDGRIIRARQTNILHAEEIEVRLPEAETTDHPGAKVLVSDQP